MYMKSTKTYPKVSSQLPRSTQKCSKMYPKLATLTLTPDVLKQESLNYPKVFKQVPQSTQKYLQILSQVPQST